jgi:hypothetical protein
LFNQALNIESVDTIYAVLLDEEGEVIEMVEGDYSVDKLRKLLKSD